MTQNVWEIICYQTAGNFNIAKRNRNHNLYLFLSILLRCVFADSFLPTQREGEWEREREAGRGGGGREKNANNWKRAIRYCNYRLWNHFQILILDNILFINDKWTSIFNIIMESSVTSIISNLYEELLSIQVLVFSPDENVRNSRKLNARNGRKSIRSQLGCGQNMKPNISFHHCGL